jgi:hypothetical protein
VSSESLLGQPLQAVNIGLQAFAEALEAQGVTVIQVDWRPPAGDASIADLLARLDDDD